MDDLKAALARDLLPSPLDRAQAQRRHRSRNSKLLRLSRVLVGMALLVGAIVAPEPLRVVGGSGLGAFVGGLFLLAWSLSGPGGRLQRHIEEAVQWLLEPGEELVAVAALARWDRESAHDIRALTALGPFDAKKVVVLTTSRVLLVNYFGVVDRHVERVAECEPADARLSLTKIGGIRLIWVDFRSWVRPGGAAYRGGPSTYRVYFRFGKQADELVRVLDSQRLKPFLGEPGGATRT